MTSTQLEEMVRRDLKALRNETSSKGSTVGVRWSEERTREELVRLSAALVTPYLLSFELGETYEQVTASAKTFAEYWVVAETPAYLQWYDSHAREYGLGQRRGDSAPISIGVRGDLVGVFCAM